MLELITKGKQSLTEVNMQSKLLLHSHQNNNVTRIGNCNGGYIFNVKLNRLMYDLKNFTKKEFGVFDKNSVSSTITSE